MQSFYGSRRNFDATLWIAAALISLLFAVNLFAMLVGIDFGRTYDEPLQYIILVTSMQHGLLLPRYYNYPSLIYWIDLGSVIDRVLPLLNELFSKWPTAPKLEFFSFDFFIFRARLVVIVLSSLGGPILFLTLIRSRLVSTPLAAVLAGGTYLCSWELGYHARWLAPDAIMATFVAAFLFCLVRAEEAEEPRRWLDAAAVAAAVAAGTKYTSGTLLPLLWLCVLMRPGTSWRGAALRILRLTAIFVALFLIITPGAILDPINFLGWIRSERNRYARGHVDYLGAYSNNIRGFWLYLTRL
jgi:4-amino-4-deoxy-L-arabinose transferase-like glycosyltransferase